jgi:hypothetical protein
MVGLVGACIARLGTPLPRDECPMAVALKQNRQVTGAEESPNGPTASACSHGLSATVAATLPLVSAVNCNLFTDRSLLR